MTSSFRQILCPVYFDETSPIALEYARQVAKKTGGTIQLLHVVPTDEVHLLRKVYHPDIGGGANVVWAEKVARDILLELAEEHLSDTPHEIVTRTSSDPVTGILAAEKELGSDLVVMATHGRTGLTHFILGSVAEKVVRESRTPVLTTRSGEKLGNTHPFRKILVPIDIAERSNVALVCARQLAEQFQGTIYPLHIVPNDEAMLRLREGAYHAREGEHGANLVLAEKTARQRLQELAREYLNGVPYETVLHVSGDPGKTIIETERDIGADLMVMATHGVTGILHFLLRSLTEKMVREADCPVLSLHQ
ncbi:MAG: universal stress protein [Deltaproteobacteria bacterium]|nr:universal stress protein [Deltaproteobacteria bacterium]